MRKLTAEQQRILDAMKRKPDNIFTAEKLGATIATLNSLGRRGLVAGVHGETSTKGMYRGMWWKLTQQGKAVQP